VLVDTADTACSTPRLRIYMLWLHRMVASYRISISRETNVQFLHVGVVYGQPLACTCMPFFNEMFALSRQQARDLMPCRCRQLDTAHAWQAGKSFVSACKLHCNGMLAPNRDAVQFELDIQ
jgi:hypothetical protein